MAHKFTNGTSQGEDGSFKYAASAPSLRLRSVAGMATALVAMTETLDGSRELREST